MTDRDVSKSSRKADPDSASRPLVMDLIGPFVIHFCERMVRIHAPICDGHFANILTDYNDLPLSGLTAAVTTTSTGICGFVYGFAAGASPDPGSCDPSQTDKTLLLNLNMKPIDKERCHLVFEAPLPDNLYPLVTEWTWIHNNDANACLDPSNEVVQGDYARGLRLIYSSCRTNPKIEPRQFESQELAAQLAVGLSLCTLNCDAIGFDPPHYHLSLRYASANQTLDVNHEDAYSCFQRMRSLVADAYRWRVDFDDSIAPIAKCLEGKSDIGPAYGANVLSLSGAHPVDCLAPVLVVYG